MQKTKAMQYTVEGPEDLNEFAKAILTLTNLKSNKHEDLIDFRTFEGTNLIEITCRNHWQQMIESAIGRIKNSNTIELLTIEDSDIDSKTIDEIYEYDELDSHIVLGIEN